MQKQIVKAVSASLMSVSLCIAQSHAGVIPPSTVRVAQKEFRAQCAITLLGIAGLSFYLGAAAASDGRTTVLGAIPDDGFLDLGGFFDSKESARRRSEEHHQQNMKFAYPAFGVAAAALAGSIALGVSYVNLRPTLATVRLTGLPPHTIVWAGRERIETNVGTAFYGLDTDEPFWIEFCLDTQMSEGGIRRYTFKFLATPGVLREIPFSELLDKAIPKGATAQKGPSE